MSWIITGTEKSPVDPYFRNVSLLLHGDGTNGSTTIVDSSSSPKTVTAFGDAQISTAQSKFGGTSIAFDGNGDYLALPVSNDFAFGTGNFTCELWVRPNILGLRTLLDTRPVGVNGPHFHLLLDASNQPTVSDNAVQVVTSSIACPVDQFTHVAVVRSAGAISIYVGGQQSGSVANSTDFLISGTTQPRIGFTVNSTLGFNGYIDDLRITKGIARYTSNFTPPTAPFPDI